MKHWKKGNEKACLKSKMISALFLLLLTLTMIQCLVIYSYDSIGPSLRG